PVRSCLGLLCEQGTLAFNSPAIAGERAVIPHDAVAGNSHRYCVGAAGLGHGAHSPGLADTASDLGIARCLADRDLAQHLPDALLEGRATHVERQVEADPRRLYEADHPGNELLEFAIIAD